MELSDIRPIDGRCVWTSSEAAKEKSWIWEFSPAALQEIDEALRFAERKNAAMDLRAKSDFPLPTLEADFTRLAKEVDEGRGFQVLRGLPVERYELDELRIIYRGIGLYFGTPVIQTPNDDEMIDVRNQGAISTQTLPDGSRTVLRGGYSSDASLAFHTDGAHIVGLLCVRHAKQGGLSLVSSAAAVHNALLELNPLFVAALYQHFPVDRRAAQPEGEPPIYPWRIPVFSKTNGRFNCVYDRNATELGCERMKRPFTSVERSAFDAFDQMARDPDFAFATEFQPGDIQFLNNFTVLHSRTAFEDWPDSAQRRHLLRLWLDVPESRHAGINKLHLYTRTPVPTGVILEPNTAATSVV